MLGPAKEHTFTFTADNFEHLYFCHYYDILFSLVNDDQRMESRLLMSESHQASFYPHRGEHYKSFMVKWQLDLLSGWCVEAVLG